MLGLISENLITQVNITDDADNTWTLHYYVQTVTNCSGRSAYGLKITRNAAKSQPIAETTGALTHTYAEAQKWALCLAHGAVTPLTLCEMADELVDGAFRNLSSTYSARREQSVTEDQQTQTVG